MLRPRVGILFHFAHDDLAQVVQFFLGDGLQMGEQRFADDGDAGAAVVEDVFVVLGLGLCVDGNGDGADFDGAEKGVQKFGRVEKQEKDPLFGADAELEQGITDAVGVFQELLVGDPLVAALDGDFRAAAFVDVAVDEVRGDVEGVGQRDHESGCLRLMSAAGRESGLRKRAGV